MDLTSTTLQAYNAGQAVLDEQARKEKAKESIKYVIYAGTGLLLFAIIMFSIKKLKNK